MISSDHRGAGDTAKSLTRTQQDALRAIAFSAGKRESAKAGWSETGAYRRKSSSG